jgi:hypothetical protein
MNAVSKTIRRYVIHCAPANGAAVYAPLTSLSLSLQRNA